MIQTPIQKTLSVLGVVSGLALIGWETKYSLTQKLLALRAGEDNIVEYHAYIWVAVITNTMFLVGGILMICFFIWPEWFERFEKK